MAEPALKLETRELAFVRRFEIPDLSKHGPWLMKRFAAKFSDMDERTIAGYLRGIVYHNENLFLYQDHAVALAEIVFSAGIKPVRVLQERFVWVEDAKDKEQLEDAADCYVHFKEWGKRQGAERILVCEDTDVPKPLIEARLGRIFDTKVSYARL